MKIGFIGDIILSDRLTFDEALVDYLNSTDFNVANLEAPFIKSHMKPRRGKGLHQLTDVIDSLNRLNIKAVSLANNHMMDFGEEGLLNTIEHLEKNGIRCFGAGGDSSESEKPVIIEHHGEQIELYGALQAYALRAHFAGENKVGVAPWDMQLLPDTRSDAYRILFLHWNQEFEDFPEPVSKLKAEELSNSFDLVVGSHSHCLQGIQQHNKMSIVYSLGNFALPHVAYSNTALSGYPDKCYTGMVYLWDSQGQDEVLLTSMSADGEKVGLIKVGTPESIEELQKLSEPLNLSYKAYRQFYLKNRINKKPPILSRNNSINFIKFGLFIRTLQLFHFLELKVASILDWIGIRVLIKRILGLVIKRYR